MFAGKIVQNENAEDVLKIAENMIYRDIDGPSTHQRSVGGNRRHEDVMLPRKYWGILTKCEATEGMMVHRPSDPLVLIECSLSARFENIQSVEQQRTSMDRRLGPSILTESLRRKQLKIELKYGSIEVSTIRRYLDGPSVRSST